MPVSTNASAYDPIEFNPPHSAVPRDWNSDSIYEGIRVYVGVKAIDNGSYLVAAHFYQVMGSWMADGYNATYLTPGNYSVEIDFSGEALYDDKLNGTYYVFLELYQEPVGNGSLPISTASFAAGNFTYDEFVEPAHAEHIADSGNDSDADGLFNYLVVDVQVHVTYNWGFYNLMGNLEGVGWDSVEGFLPEGLSNMSLSFDGQAIRNTSVNGPYMVQLILMDPYSTPVWSGAYQTGNYTWDQFSNPTIPPPPPPPSPISFLPPHSGHPVDTDADSLYEFFLVNVTVNVTEPGWYTVVGVLYTPPTRWSSGVWTNNFSLHEVGVNVTVLSFYASDIHEYGLDGEFSVELRIYSQSWGEMAYATWALGNYSLASFDPEPLTHLEGPCTDAGLDTNDDGLFEYLVVSVQVHVSLAGTYGLSAWINNVMMDNASGPVRVVANLTEGFQTVELRFNGELFVNASLDGPYTVWIDLMDSDFNRWYMSEEYTTANYSYSQFSANVGAKFGFPHSDAALDVNGDGAMEYLAVYVNVTVLIPGIYNVTGALSVYVDVIDRAWNREYLGAGHWDVPLLFSGAAIKATKWNGSYPVLLDLIDGDGVLLWSSSHYTRWYTWIAFAKPPVAAAVATPVGDIAGRNFALNASASSVEAVLYEVRWDFNGDGLWDTDWSWNTTILHEFPAPGNYTVLVQIRDVRGLTNTSSITVSVPPSPHSRFDATSILPMVAFSLAAIVAVGVVVILIAWPVESLLLALLALLLPLYSRLRKDDVLDNYKRGMIHGLILAHPGISFTEMKQALSISSGSLVYHLSVLQEKGEILCRKSGTTMRYYLDGSPVANMVRLGLTGFQLEIVKHILSEGETTKKDLRMALKCSRQVLHYNLRKLATDGILVSSLSRGHWVYRIASGVKPEISRALESKEEHSETASQDHVASQTEG